MRASATYRAALRMLPYTQRRPAPQLCRLLLTLVLVSVPLKGMPAARASRLIPLRTTFVPFDTSIQSPNPTAIQFSVAAPSDRRVALAPSTISFPIPQQQNVSPDMVIDDHCRSGVPGFPCIRSPPRA